jgi:hypothetical protein
MLAANNSWVLAFDNLSGLAAATSDALCSLATGGGYTTRTLYTDDEETIFDACRPVILNGIVEVATRPDLLDRSLVFQLPTIEKRKTKQKLDKAFRERQPRILGALLDGVVHALATQDQVDIEHPPRMADFAHWAAAAMPAFGWDAERFLTAYEQNIAMAAGTALEDSPIVPWLQKLVSHCGDQWPKDEQPAGAEALLIELNRLAPAEAKAGWWPKRGRDLSGALRRLAPALRHSGLQIEMGQRQTTGQRITPIRLWTSSTKSQETNGNTTATANSTPPGNATGKGGREADTNRA